MTTHAESPTAKAKILAKAFTIELTQLLSSKEDSTIHHTHRRARCTRILTQWKTEILPNLSKKGSLDLLIHYDDEESFVAHDVIHFRAGQGDGDEAANEHEGSNGNSVSGINVKTHYIVPILLSLINNEADFTTEGHREMSVEILKSLLHRAFDAAGNHGDCNNKSELPPPLNEHQPHGDKNLQIQMQLFQRFTVTFQKRMHRCSNNNGLNYRHGNASQGMGTTAGTMIEPIESSEHIRLLLVELISDFGTYLISFLNNFSGWEKDGNKREGGILFDQVIISLIIALATIYGFCVSLLRSISINTWTLDFPKFATCLCRNLKCCPCIMC